MGQAKIQIGADMDSTPHHNEKTIETVIRMWKDHKTGTQIAVKLDMTRSAVMGLVSRLRAKGFLEYRDPAAKKNATADEKRNKLRNPYVPSHRRQRLPPLPPIKEDSGIVRLFDLKASSCRFIVNDSPKAADFLFCGQPKKVGSYCQEHHDICFVKPQPRNKGVRRKPFQLNPRYAEKK
jgi:hypothetical protein